MPDAIQELVRAAINAFVYTDARLSANLPAIEGSRLGQDSSLSPSVPQKGPPVAQRRVRCCTALCAAASQRCRRSACQRKARPCNIPHLLRSCFLLTGDREVPEP